MSKQAWSGGAGPRQKLIKAAMRQAAFKRENFHVIPSEDRWVVLREGSKRASKILPSRASAVKAAVSLGRESHTGELIIHGRDGSVQERRPFAGHPIRTSG